MSLSVCLVCFIAREACGASTNCLSHHICFSCHYFADHQRLCLAYTETFHYPPRTRLLYQSRELPKHCWKPHSPTVGEHLGEMPIHYTKRLGLIYGMICLAFTRLSRSRFVTRQDLKAKESINIDCL